MLAEQTHYTSPASQARSLRRHQHHCVAQPAVALKQHRLGGQVGLARVVDEARDVARVQRIQHLSNAPIGQHNRVWA